MIIAATSDVHSPMYYEEFVRAIAVLTSKPDLFLIAGDMVHRGEIGEWQKIVNALSGKFFCPIVACFGNNEYQQLRDELKEKFREVRFLDDQSLVLKVGDTDVGVFGTTGSLETPTPWQKANVPNIEKTYAERITLAEKHLHRMPRAFRILLTHYSPTYRTLEGENPRFFSSMGNQLYENVINAQKPNLVLHGHSHRGLKQSWIDTVPVFNVAIQVNRGIVVIDTDKLKPGLAKFV